INTCYQIENGCFSSAIRADQPNELALADFQRKIRHGFEPAELNGAMINREQRARHTFDFRAGSTPPNNPCGRVSISTMSSSEYKIIRLRAISWSHGGRNE